MFVVIAINECPVCYDPTTHKTRCGHLLCESCFGRIMNGKCPLCREYLTDEIGRIEEREAMIVDINRKLRPFFIAIIITLIVIPIGVGLICLL